MRLRSIEAHRGGDLRPEWSGGRNGQAHLAELRTQGDGRVLAQGYRPRGDATLQTHRGLSADVPARAVPLATPPHGPAGTKAIGRPPRVRSRPTHYSDGDPPIPWRCRSEHPQTTHRPQRHQSRPSMPVRHALKRAKHATGKNDLCNVPRDSTILLCFSAQLSKYLAHNIVRFFSFSIG
jgi:hypothetical protein